jgi:hypothetical protein
MTDIPEQATINLPNLQRSALKSLLDNAPPHYQLDDLLELVIIKGIAALVKGRELPDISDEIHERAKASIPMGNRASRGPRVAADYVGCSIDAHQRAALEELEGRFRLVDEDELLRVLLDVALRALPEDAIAQARLNAVVFTDELLEGDAS